MKILRTLICWALSLLFADLAAQQQFLVMEYNVENLFDCKHDTLKDDYMYLPDSPRGWTVSKFNKKIQNISKVILASSGKQVPDIVGLCEIENEYCAHNLVKYSPLKAAGYEYVMTNSPDLRGIDVLLLYQPYTFRLLQKNIIRIPTHEIGGRPTRDILHVSGMVVSGDTLDVFLCHFPSRFGGQKYSEPFRLMAANRLRTYSDSINSVRQSPHIIIMGDFNDYPGNKSIKDVIGASRPMDDVLPEKLYNLMDGKSDGTYRYKGEWGILDQMIVNGRLLKEGSITTSQSKAHIIRFPFLLEEDDKYGGVTPFRTYIGMRYHGGYSDHLPVMLELEINDN